MGEQQEMQRGPVLVWQGGQCETYLHVDVGHTDMGFGRLFILDTREYGMQSGEAPLFEAELAALVVKMMELSPNARRAALDALCGPHTSEEQANVEIAAMRDLLIPRPTLRCTKCGYLTSGSGNWACKECGKWHYWTGMERGEFDPSSPRGQEWLAKVTPGVDARIAAAVAALSEPKEASPSE